MKKQKKKMYWFFAITVAIIIGGISFMLIDEGQSAGALKFNVPVPLEAFSLFDDRNEDITCEIFMHIDIIDADGKILRTKNTRPLSGNPTFALVDALSGKPLAGYTIEPVMGCNSKHLGVTIDPSDLFLIVTATDSDKSVKNVINKKIKTNTISLPASSDIKRSIGYFGILVPDIENNLSGSEFQSKIRFEIVGTLKLHYTDYSSYNFYFPISKPNTGDSSPLAFSTFANIQSKVETTEINDYDGDGILNASDSCPNNPEIYNGYNDSDGCPDTPPSNESTLKTDCENSGGVWRTVNNGDSYCDTDGDTTDDSPPPSTDEECSDTTNTDTNSCPAPEENDGTNPIDTTEECQTEFGSNYTWNGTLCVPPETTEECDSSDPSAECDVTPTPTSSPIVDAEVRINTRVTYSDGSVHAFLIPLEGQQPFGITLNPATLIDKRAGATKEISEISVQAFLLPTELKSWTITKSNMNYIVTATSNDGEIRIGEFPQQTFVKTSGSGANPDFGLPLGRGIIKQFDINSKISENITVPVGTSKTFNLKIVPTGNIVVQKVDTTYSGVVKDANVNWNVLYTNFKQAGDGGSTTGGNTNTSINCSENERIHIFPDGKADCVAKGTIPEDKDGDGTISGDETQACTIGEAGCDICISDNNPNGFPCGLDYRQQFCGDDTDCEIDPDISSDDVGVQGCLDSFGQPTICTSDPEPNSNSGKGGSIGSFCPVINGESICPEGFDDNTTYIIIGGVLFFIIVAIALSRRRSYQPY